jgi:hypothetical protein
VTEGVEMLAAAVVQQAVASAVAAEVTRATLQGRDVDQAFFGGTRAEVVRLRQVVADQAQQITALQNRLEEAQREAHRLEMRQLVDAVSAAVLTGTASLDGYTVSDAHVQVRAALEINNGRVTVTADPGGLLGVDGLSTFDVHLQSLPPQLGEPLLSSAADAVRTALAALQAALDEADLVASTRAAGLRAVSDLISTPTEARLWLPLSTVLETVAEAGGSVAASGHRAAAAARDTALAATARNLTGVGQALGLLAADLRLMPR